jgi:hypothetical protein
VYLSISFENFITIGVMLLVWMVGLHVLGQLGIRVSGLLPGGGV